MGEIELVEREINQRLSAHACKVCGNSPSIDSAGFSSPGVAYAVISHGKGCFTQSEDGGGDETVDIPCELAAICNLLFRISELRAKNARLEAKVLQQQRELMDLRTELSRSIVS